MKPDELLGVDFEREINSLQLRRRIDAAVDLLQERAEIQVSPFVRRSEECKAAVDAERQNIANVHGRIALRVDERNALREQRGRRIVAGEKSSDVDKTLRSLDEDDERDTDEIAARTKHLAALEKDELIARWEANRAIRNAFAEESLSITVEAFAAKQRWGAVLDLSETVKKRLDILTMSMSAAHSRVAEHKAKHSALYEGTA